MVEDYFSRTYVQREVNNIQKTVSHFDLDVEEQQPYGHIIIDSKGKAISCFTILENIIMSNLEIEMDITPDSYTKVLEIMLQYKESFPETEIFIHKHINNNINPSTKQHYTHTYI